MQRNLSSLDRLVRTFLGFGLLSLVVTGPTTNWGYLGVIPLFTSLLGYCPLYAVLRISTYKHLHR